MSESDQERMTAYGDALVIDTDASEQQVALAADLLARRAGIVVLDGVLALRATETGLLCEVLDPMPATHRCANEYDVLMENAQRALAASRLRDLLPDLPRRWSVVSSDATPRPAVRSDIPALQRVRLAVRENRLSDPARITEADYVAAMEELGRTWVIEEGGEVVAFASGYATGSVWALFVHPDHEGRGHGKALHAVMVGWLWSLGHSRLWLTTESGSRAERFYVAQGWRLADTTPDGELRLELTAPRTPARSAD